MVLKYQGDRIKKHMAAFKFHCIFCQQPIEADEQWLGQKAFCPSCNKEICIEKESLRASNVVNVNDNDKDINSIGESNMKEYKVLTQKDKWFSGKFDPELLEKAINAYAQQGWKVISATTASFPGFLNGNRDEMVVILERDK